MISESIITYNLKSCLSSCLEISKQEGFSDITEVLIKVLDNLDAPMQLAIIGKVSSSKSTLVNAILGKADVVGTGQMEETFNVSWLKYGPSDADIKVVFKDDTIRYIPRNDWKNWSGQVKNAAKDKVRYLEVTYEHKILKSINIIDTPGLDSEKRIDSLNTINFLKDVRPDAIIMAFTRGLAQNTLELIKEFQCSGSNSFSVTPLTAIGLLTKTDFMWHIKEKDIRPNNKAQRDVIDGNIYSQFPEVKDALFSILPICSMLALASSTIEDNDINLINKLSATPDGILYEMLHSANDFLDDYFQTELSIIERKYLLDKFGLYGIFEAVSLAQNHNLTIDSLKSLFREISGYDCLEDMLYSHFGQRSILIKTQSSNQIISAACDKQREQINSDSKRKAIDSIQERLLTCLLSIFEYKQIDFLTKLYDKTMNIDDPVAIEEYKRVCGEYGASVVSKLGIEGKPSVEKMLEISSNRNRQWNAKYHQAYHISRDKAELYHMLSSSYDMMSKDIVELSKKAIEAEKIINMTNTFFYGK